MICGANHFPRHIHSLLGGTAEGVPFPFVMVRELKALAFSEGLCLESTTTY